LTAGLTYKPFNPDYYEVFDFTELIDLMDEVLRYYSFFIALATATLFITLVDLIGDNDFC